MTITEIVKDLAEHKEIEKIINNIGKGSFENVDDLAQDLYVELLDTPHKQEKYIQMYEQGAIRYLLVCMVRNNLFSKNSRYYYNYKRWIDNKSPELTDSDIENNSEEYHNYENLIEGNA